ncbi:MAG: 50S ribosomal protein L11 methyltransferase [Armatimonadetes bacterium]|nr:50S ribosomal protein L11 methyltransferase [Armatimonadota bacterium]
MVTQKKRQTEAWRQASVHVATETVDVVSQLFIEAGCAGTVIEEDEGGSIVSGYFPRDATGDAGLSALERSLDGASQHLAGLEAGSLRTTGMAAVDWAENWKLFFTPIEVGTRFVIQPSWYSKDPEASLNGSDNRIILVLDPGMAFGTGHHSTTRFCLELLERHVKPGQSIIDLGTGSGLLSIAASKLGAGHVVAIDNDPLAIEATLENIKRNRGGAFGAEVPAGLDSGTVHPIEVIQGDLKTVEKGCYDIVVANLTTPQILCVLGNLHRLLVPKGLFIGSGVSLSHKGELVAALGEAGFVLHTMLEDEEWVGFATHLPSLPSA